MTKIFNILWYRKVYSRYHCEILHSVQDRPSPSLKAEDENRRKLSPKAIFLICIAVLSAMGCGQKSKSQAELSQAEEIPSSQKELEEASQELLSSFSLSGYAKGGKKQWDLEGKSADIMVEEIKLLDVIGRLYGKQTNMNIVADEGSLNRIDNSIHLEKNVKATTDDGATMTADYLDWDAPNQKVTSESPVWIERGMMQAQGTGIIAQPVLNLVQLKKDVTVKLYLKETTKPAQRQEAANLNQREMISPTVITCAGPLEVDYQNNLAIFQDNVKVKDERGEILADKMDIYFVAQAQETKQIQGMEGMGVEKIVATGDVEIYHGDNITYSQRAVYDTDTGKLTLTGQPKLVIYSTESFSQVMGAE